MLIKNIRMKNFRQFKGDQKLEFACDYEKNVTVLLGDNTFGKTTILQAFNWCLYDVAEFPKDSNPDFLLNMEAAEEAARRLSPITKSVIIPAPSPDTEIMLHMTINK